MKRPDRHDRTPPAHRLPRKPLDAPRPLDPPALKRVVGGANPELIVDGGE